MRARDLRLSEIVQFDDHHVGLSGRRLVLHDMHAFAQFRKDIVDSVGLEQARRMFTRFGTFWGEADAAAMKRLFRWDSLEELVLAGPRMHSLQGVTRAVVKSFRLDRPHFMMEVTWHESGEADEHLLELGRASDLLSGTAHLLRRRTLSRPGRPRLHRRGPRRGVLGRGSGTPSSLLRG
jgi:hypothetical protein